MFHKLQSEPVVSVSHPRSLSSGTLANSWLKYQQKRKCKLRITSLPTSSTVASSTARQHNRKTSTETTKALLGVRELDLCHLIQARWTQKTNPQLKFPGGTFVWSKYDVSMEVCGYLLKEMRDHANLEMMREYIKSANIFIESLIFVQYLAELVVEAFNPVWYQLDATVIFPSMSENMRLNKLIARSQAQALSVVFDLDTFEMERSTSCQNFISHESVIKQSPLSMEESMFP